MRGRGSSSGPATGSSCPFELRLAFAHRLFFFRREKVIGIDRFLGLDDNYVFGAYHLNKIALLESQLCTHLLRDHDLASLAQVADGHYFPLRSVTIL
jgi:hypothetical protein